MKLVVDVLLNSADGIDIISNDREMSQRDRSRLFNRA